MRGIDYILAYDFSKEVVNDIRPLTELLDIGKTVIESYGSLVTQAPPNLFGTGAWHPGVARGDDKGSFTCFTGAKNGCTVAACCTGLCVSKGVRVRGALFVAEYGSLRRQKIEADYPRLFRRR